MECLFMRVCRISAAGDNRRDLIWLSDRILRVTSDSLANTRTNYNSASTLIDLAKIKAGMKSPSK